MNRLSFLLAVLLIVACTSCNYSKYPIDEKPIVKVDNGLYGIWKVKNDTNKKNFILIQDGDEDGWHRNDKEHEYYVTYFNQNGTNRNLENFDMHFSEVEGMKFLNLAYVNFGEKEVNEQGYIFFKVARLDDSKSNMVITYVDDPALKDMNSSSELRDRIAKQINNTEFYKETYELYNVAKGHFTQRQAVDKAN